MALLDMMKAPFLALGFSLVLLAPDAEAVEVQQVVSPGGIEAWLVEDHSNPIIAIDFTFRGGASEDPMGLEGLANLVSGLLDEGAGSIASQDFQAALADNNITLSYDAGRDSFSGTFVTLTRNLDMAGELLAVSMTRPRFDEEPVQRIRRQIEASLRQDAEDPQSIAWRAAWARMFPNHPYGRDVDGDFESLKAITRDDLLGFVKRNLSQDRLLVGVSGDITPDQLSDFLDRTFGLLPERGAPLEVPDVTPTREGGIEVIERPQPQSVIVMAQPGIKRDDPDYYTATIVNYILGGGSFSSRLYEEVREKRGLAYSVYSGLLPLDHAGLIIAGSGTRNDAVAETLDVMRSEWQRLAEEGPTEEEVVNAKTYVNGNFPLRLSSTGSVAGILVGMQYADLGLTYLDDRADIIRAISTEDVRRVAKRLLDEAQLSIFVVGKPEGLEPTRDSLLGDG